MLTGRGFPDGVPQRCGRAPVDARRIALVLAVVALSLSACRPVPTRGTFLRRERYGAVILHLDDGRTGRIGGDISLTGLGVDGSMRVFSRRLDGTRDGDRLTVRDNQGARLSIDLSEHDARVTAPDGGVMVLARSDPRQEGALLADLTRQATDMRKRRAPSS